MKHILWAMLVVLMLLWATTSVVAAPAPNISRAEVGRHVVRAGETLFCIGRAYKVDPWAIALENGIIDVNHIHPDDILIIPNVPVTLPPGHTCTPQFGTSTSSPPSPAPACGSCTCRQKHVIVTGQTLYRIAQQYNVDMATLTTCNCLVDPSYIRIGDTLCIP